MKSRHNNDSDGSLQLQQRVYELEGELDIEKKKAALADTKSALLPFPAEHCPKCGGSDFSKHYVAASEPFTLAGSMFSYMCACDGQVESMAWLCTCGYTVYTKTKDAV